MARVSRAFLHTLPGTVDCALGAPNQSIKKCGQQLKGLKPPTQKAANLVAVAAVKLWLRHLHRAAPLCLDELGKEHQPQDLERTSRSLLVNSHAKRLRSNTSLDQLLSSAGPGQSQARIGCIPRQHLTGRLPGIIARAASRLPLSMAQDLRRRVR